jgi:DNA-binding transcriptional ArsR family regulator
MRYLSKIRDYFRKPDEETVGGILKKIGMAESDESYERLKTGLCNLIGRKIRQEDFSGFFGELSGQLRKKVDEKLSEKEGTIADLKKEMARSRKQLVAEVMAEALSPRILAMVDQESHELLKLLCEEEKSRKSLKGILNLRDDDLIWGMKYFEDLGIVESRYSGRDMIYSISDIGRAIYGKREAEFEELADLLKEDKDYQLALKAVGEDKIMAEKYLKWLKSASGRGHMGKVEKLHKRYETPKEVSQAFFREREMGVAHEKHIGIKITDHQASGELLLSELENFQRSMLPRPD